MPLKEERHTIFTVEDIPDVEDLKLIPRGLSLIIVFDGEIKKLRNTTGEYWIKQLPKFSIGRPFNTSEIHFTKLITDLEIEQHQDFFETCAVEYGLLAEQLIHQFIEEYQIECQLDFPLKFLNAYSNTLHNQTGFMGDWTYFFHGYHCLFRNTKTKQCIEVPLTFGEEFGELDPYFFSCFIKSTPKFWPLPVEIYEDYHDGKQILDGMLKLGKFEAVNSNLKGTQGVIVKKRLKKEVKIIENGMREVLIQTGLNVKKTSVFYRIKQLFKRG